MLKTKENRRKEKNKQIKLRRKGEKGKGRKNEEKQKIPEENSGKRKTNHATVFGQPSRSPAVTHMIVVFF